VRPRARPAQALHRRVLGGAAGAAGAAHHPGVRPRHRIEDRHQRLHRVLRGVLQLLQGRQRAARVAPGLVPAAGRLALVAAANGGDPVGARVGVHRLSHRGGLRPDRGGGGRVLRLAGGAGIDHRGLHEQRQRHRPHGVDPGAGRDGGRAGGAHASRRAARAALAPRVPERVMRGGRGLLLARIALVVAVLAVWQWAPQIPGITRWAPIFDPFFISAPSRIAAKFWELATTAGDKGAVLKSGNLFVQLWATLWATVLGFVVGVGSGFLAGLVLSQWRTMADILHPYLVAFNALPRIALVPLLIMVFGTGLLAKVVLAWLIVFFIVFFNTYAGGRSIEPAI